MCRKHVYLIIPPTTVLVFGNPRGGAPLMLAQPELALDLPSRVLISQLPDGQVNVSYHPVEELRRCGLDTISVQTLKNWSSSFRKVFSHRLTKRGEHINCDVLSLLSLFSYLLFTSQSALCTKLQYLFYHYPCCFMSPDINMYLEKKMNMQNHSYSYLITYSIISVVCFLLLTFLS